MNTPSPTDLGLAPRQTQIVEEGHQAPDHPVHPAIAETAYLKVFFARVLPS